MFKLCVAAPKSVAIVGQENRIIEENKNIFLMMIFFSTFLQEYIVTTLVLIIIVFNLCFQFITTAFVRQLMINNKK